MIKVDHPIRARVLKIPVKYTCKRSAFEVIKALLADYDWHMHSYAFSVSSKCGSEFYAIRNSSYSVVGGIFVAWATTFDGRVRFMAEIT